ncbi:MAG: nitrite reductase small subunit NirD [Ilumatobacteraceae bacterium]
MTILDTTSRESTRADVCGTAVARVDELPVDRGVAVLVDGHPVALFRLADGAIFAIDHIEPFTHVPVLARGLVGSVGDVATVSSPLHKQRFDLDTGRCVDDAAYAVGTWQVSVVDGVVTIGDRRPAAA